MIREIDYYEIDRKLLKLDYILVDLRSPSEFNKFTIPGAINIPIFDDAERELIGYTYTRKSKSEAKEIGVNIVSRKLPDMYRQIVELEREHRSVIFFCERGGMRSSSIVGLLANLGARVYKLKGGYKGYRAYINENLPKLIDEINFIVVHGHTGVGKTKILQEIDALGGGMLDLEGCANHRGSLFGAVGLEEVKSQKQFETNVYEQLKKRKSDTLFVEAESKRIGKVMIPDFIFQKMDAGRHVNVYASMKKRVEVILEDYDGEKSEIIEALDKLKKYISRADIEDFMKKIEGGDYASVAESLMRDYYDPMYKKKDRPYMAEFENLDEVETARDLIEWLNTREDKSIQESL